MKADKIIKNEKLGEAIYFKTLSSGLSVYVMPKKHFAKKYVYFATHYGGFSNQIEMTDGKVKTLPHGTAHFLEHQIFEDADNPPFERFAALGANVNAYTGFHTTVYHFETIHEIEEPMGILMDMVQHARITPESVEKEKSVITQEIKMYSDEPNWQLMSEVRCAMYHKHPLRTDIAGTVDSVQKIDLETLQLCFEAFYTPSNMAVFVYGDVNADQVFEAVDRLQVDRFKKRKIAPKTLFPDEPLAVAKKEVQIIRPVEKNRLLLGFKAQPLDDKIVKTKYLAALRVANDLMFGESSDFHEIAYKGGLVAEPIDMEVQSGRGYAYVILGAETDDVIALETHLLERIKTYKKTGFLESDFLRVKKKLIGRYVFSFNSLQSIASNYTFNKMRGDDLFDQLEAYNTLTTGDLIEAVRYFYSEDNYTRALLLKTS